MSDLDSNSLSTSPSKELLSEQINPDVAATEGEHDAESLSKVVESQEESKLETFKVEQPLSPFFNQDEGIIGKFIRILGDI